MRDLKQYRPHRKPILDCDVGHPALLKNKVLLHKRKLLVRDWLYFVVWSMRLKKILKTVYKDESGSLMYMSHKYK